MKKRIIAIALVLMLAVSLLPASALADAGICVCVGGKYFTQANQTISVGGGTATLQYVDYMNFKLILNNVNITSFVKNFSNNGLDYYAGILYLDESKMGTMVVEFQGNNSITAPAHGSNAVYEGIFSTGRMIFRGDNLSINGVDVGIEAGTTFSTEGTECEVFFGNKNLTINATNTDVYCEWLEIGSCNCTFNSTGYNCVTTSYKFTTNKSTQLKLNLTPDVNKGYGNPAAMMCTNSCAVFGSLNINVNLDASEYKGAEEITAFGVYADAIWFDSNRQYVNVNLNSGGNAAAVGIYCDILNMQSEKEYPLLSSKVSISGEHKESSAILCETSACFSGKAEAVITGASEYDCAYECYGNTAIRNNIFYAQTDCKNALYGAVYSAGDFSAWNPIFTPANGVKQNIGGEEAGIIIADADGNPADCVVIAADGNPFRDIYDQIDAFKTSILWANDMKITSGVTPVEFRPTAACTRGQIVTFLWRAMGSPEPALTCNPFVDVKETSPYYKAILWAVEKGITNGYDATHFKPSIPCTRAQVVTFLWRAEGKPAPECDDNPFKDVSASGSTKPYYDAILWAAEQGITGGYTPTEFRPNNICNRGQIVTFIYRDMKDSITRQPDVKKIVNVSIDTEIEPTDDMLCIDYTHEKITPLASFPVVCKVNYSDGTSEDIVLNINQKVEEMPENWAELVAFTDYNVYIRYYAYELYQAYGTDDRWSILGFDVRNLEITLKDAADEIIKTDDGSLLVLEYANPVEDHVLRTVNRLDLNTGKYEILLPSICGQDWKLVGDKFYYVDKTTVMSGQDIIGVYYKIKAKYLSTGLYEIIGEFTESQPVLDGTGYSVTQIIDGEEVTTHYDFP